MRPCKSWTDIETNRAVAWRRDGLRLGTIARRLGRSEPSVSAKLKALRVLVETHTAWTALEIARAVAWRRAGVKLDTIARRLGRSRSSVLAQLSRRGVLVEPHKAMRRRHGALLRRVTALLRAGESVTGAAEICGAHYSYVSRVRKRLGLPAATTFERLSRSWVVRKVAGQRPPDRHARAGAVA